MRRNQRNTPGRRPNPLREMVAEQKRKADLPALIEDQVSEQIQRLENKLLRDYKQMGQKAIEESAAVLNEQLSERIETLEQISSIQSRTIVNLRNSSKVAEQNVSSAVNSIEKTLAGAVPGFRLESRTELIKADPREIGQISARYGAFCPSCTSTNIRRANRQGLFEEFLRLFFIAPFRCRACRRKFYRF